jgi:hypothetical protein
LIVAVPPAGPVAALIARVPAVVMLLSNFARNLRISSASLIVTVPFPSTSPQRYAIAAFELDVMDIVNADSIIATVSSIANSFFFIKFSFLLIT